MKSFLILSIVILALVPVAVQAQDWVLVVDSFPVDTGSSAAEEILSPYAPLFAVWQMALEEDSTLSVEIVAYADATRYQKYHDLRNAAIAASRYTGTADYLVNVIGMPRSRILPMKTGEFKEKGSEFRRVEISLVRTKPEIAVTPAPSRKDTIVVVQQQTNAITNFFSMAEVSAGLTYGVFEKPMFTLRGRLGNETVSFDAEFGFSFASTEWSFQGMDYQTSYRLIAGHLVYSPLLNDSHKIEFIGGWERNERRLDAMAAYVVKKEGIALGVGYRFNGNVSVRALWCASEQYNFADNSAHWNYDGFRVSVNVSKIWR